METVRTSRSISSLNERFVSTAGQTSFTPTKFILSSACIVFVSGIEQSWGWSRVAGSVVFDAPGLAQGTEVLIIN